MTRLLVAAALLAILVTTPALSPPAEAVEAHHPGKQEASKKTNAKASTTLKTKSKRKKKADATRIYSHVA